MRDTMKIAQINLRERLDQVRFTFDSQLAEVLLSRPDLTYIEIKSLFGVSDKVIRRVMRQFHVKARKRGPKTSTINTAVSRETEHHSALVDAGRS
jgi:hypothetical protein